MRVVPAAHFVCGWWEVARAGLLGNAGFEGTLDCAAREVVRAGELVTGVQDFGFAEPANGQSLEVLVRCGREAPFVCVRFRELICPRRDSAKR